MGGYWSFIIENNQEKQATITAAVGPQQLAVSSSDCLRCSRGGSPSELI